MVETYEIARGFPIGYIDVADDGTVTFSNNAIRYFTHNMVLLLGKGPEVTGEKVRELYRVLSSSYTMRRLTPLERLFL